MNLIYGHNETPDGMLARRVKRRTNSWKNAGLAILCNTCLFASMATAQQSSNEIRPEVDTFVKLNEQTRLFLLGSGTRTKEQGYSDGTLGVHLDLFTSPLFKTRLERTAQRADVARKKFLQFRIGYLYSRSAKSSSTQFSEHTPTVEVSPWTCPYF